MKGHRSEGNQFPLRTEINPELHWSSLTAICCWSKKLAPPFRPIRFKIKTNEDSVAKVSPPIFRFSIYLPASECATAESRSKEKKITFVLFPWETS